MSESTGKSGTELTIETFVDRMKEIHPELDRQGFHEAISGYVQEEVTAAESEEESDSEE